MNQDGYAEYRASLDGTLEAVDDNSNGIFEKATLTIRAEASVDANSDGFPEDHSYATLDGVVLNTIEDNHPDRVELHLVATGERDFNSDGLVDETRGATIDLLAIDVNSNGAFESTNVTIRARAVRDANHDGVPEDTAPVVGYAQAPDANGARQPEDIAHTAQRRCAAD